MLWTASIWKISGNLPALSRWGACFWALRKRRWARLYAPPKVQHTVSQLYAGETSINIDCKENKHHIKRTQTSFRFEKLDITPRSALKIRPVLEKWLKEAEEKQQQAEQGNLAQAGGLDYVNMGAIGKIRKRRTFFSPEALLVLNKRFEQNSHPSGEWLNDC